MIWTIERTNGTISDVVVTFTCSYSHQGVVISEVLASDRPYQVVLTNGENEVTKAVEIRDSAFLHVDGVFQVILDEVKLLNGGFFVNFFTYIVLPFIYHCAITDCIHTTNTVNSSYL